MTDEEQVVGRLERLLGRLGLFLFISGLVARDHFGYWHPARDRFWFFTLVLLSLGSSVELIFAEIVEEVCDGRIALSLFLNLS